MNPNEILCLSGWAQSANALSGQVTKLSGHAAQGFNYLSLTPEMALEKLGAYPHRYYLGWSLGGTLLMEAWKRGRIQPEKIFLITTPFAFLPAANCPVAMSPENFLNFSLRYKQQPQKTLGRFRQLILHGDDRQSEITPLLDSCDDESMQPSSGSEWLEWLGRVNFSTTSWPNDASIELCLLAGAKDAIVPAAQADYWKKSLPKAELHLMPEAAHAPHLHAPERFGRLIQEFFR